MVTIMPAKTINLHINDVPWMTGHLKHLIKCRQKALKDNCPTQFKFYRNQERGNMLKLNIMMQK